jgi:DNA-directed RNA polymerase I, II, and III subunit RPABC1
MINESKSRSNITINVEYNNKEINEIILENVLKMLVARKLIDSWEDEYKKLINIETNNIFEIKLNNNQIYSIYLLNQIINTIIQGSQLDEYLSNNINIHKIVIAKNITKKILKQINIDYQNVEIFFEYEMLEHILDKVFIPKHELLNADEKKELLNKFNENELSKIFISDIMSRYYGAKNGDIFRIIRPSITAGKSIFYRKVINASWDILFP